MNDYLQRTMDWFIKEKGPHLDQKIGEGMVMLQNGIPFDKKYRMLFALALFLFTMHQGPGSFSLAVDAAEEIGVLDELTYYANDWIDTAKKFKATRNN